MTDLTGDGPLPGSGVAVRVGAEEVVPFSRGQLACDLVPCYPATLQSSVSPFTVRARAPPPPLPPPSPPPPRPPPSPPPSAPPPSPPDFAVRVRFEARDSSELRGVDAAAFRAKLAQLLGVPLAFARVEDVLPGSAAVEARL